MNIAFADESGISPSDSCYSIGMLILEERLLEEFNSIVQDLAQQHGVCGEASWHKINKSHGLINFCLQLLTTILSGSLRYSIIVVNKQLYKNWQQSKDAVNREEAFYKTYTQLITLCADQLGDKFTVYCDDRSDTYPFHREAMANISNRILKQRKSKGRIEVISAGNSKLTPGIQAVDILTGAINCAHNRVLAKKPPVLNRGKLLCINKLAQILGWDDLRYDTHPNSKFNIWHFPLEWRGPSRVIAPSFENIPFVSRSDFL